MFPVVRNTSIAIAFVTYIMALLLVSYDILQSHTLDSVKKEIEQHGAVIEDFHVYGGVGQTAHEALAFTGFVEPAVDMLDEVYLAASFGQSSEKGRQVVIGHLRAFNGAWAGIVFGVDIACRTLLTLREQSSDLAQLKVAATLSEEYTKKPSKQGLMTLLDQYQQSAKLLIKIDEQLNLVVPGLAQVNGWGKQAPTWLEETAKSAEPIITRPLLQLFLNHIIRPASENIDTLHTTADDHQQKVSRSLVLIVKVQKSAATLQAVDNALLLLPGAQAIVAVDDGTKLPQIILSMITVLSAIFMFTMNALIDHQRRAATQQRSPRQRISP